jgi:triphosphoribosyl-dephospho-CoA synthase
VHALFATMAVLDDTNLVHRGGMEGLRFAQSLVEQFLATGSVFQADWLAQARAVHTEFVRRNLSPGGSADVLASACWMNAVCKPSPRTAIAELRSGNPQMALTT